MKLFILPVFFLLTHVVVGQSYNWIRTNGSFAEDRVFGVAHDSHGNEYVAGQLQDAVDFGTFTLQANNGDLDAFVVKYDSSGTALWGFAGGGFAEDGAYAVATDTNGNVYVTGTYVGAALFGNVTLTSTLGFDNDIFILALDSNGNMLWVKSAGGEGYDAGRGIAVSSNGVYVVGGIVVPATFETQTVDGFGFGDGFLARYHFDGSLDWVNACGGLFNDLTFAVATDAGGNAFATGYFQDTASFGSFTLNNASTDNTDLFVFKTDSDGATLWAHGGGNANNDDFGRTVATDPAGDVFVGGDFNSIANFDGQVVISAGAADGLVLKYNNDGLIQYAKRVGGSFNDRVYGIAATANSVYIGGAFNTSAQFGSTTLSSAGDNDIFIARMDNANGDVLSALRGGGDGTDAGRAVDATNGALYLGGDFDNGSATFGTISVSSNGSHDFFLAQLDASLSVYPCPFTATISPGSLLMCPNTAEVLGTQVYASYQWLKDGLPIAGATQQNYVVHANTDGGSLFNVVATMNGCADTSAPVLADTWTFLLPDIQQSSNGWFDGQAINICNGDTMLLTLLPPYTDSVQWFNNGLEIPGATASSYAVTQSGTYIARGAPPQCMYYLQNSIPIDVVVHPTLVPDIVFSNDTLYATPAGISYQWYYNGTILAGATNAFEIPAQPGSYTVMPTDSEQCGTMSLPYVITSLVPIIAATFKLFPNPASEIMYLDVPRAFAFNVIDATGRIVLTGVNQNGIDVSPLPNGFYILALTINKQTTNLPFGVSR